MDVVYSSNLVESSNFYRLHVVIHLLYFLYNTVDGYFLVLEGEGDDELENTESNWLLFVLGLPEEAILLDVFEYFLGEIVQVSCVVQWLNFKHDEGHGNDYLLLLLFLLSFSLGLGGGSCSSIIVTIIITEEVKVIIFLLCLLLIAAFLATFLLSTTIFFTTTTGSTSWPRVLHSIREFEDEAEPGEGVWMCLSGYGSRLE
jgi:hypothetical protein